MSSTAFDEFWYKIVFGTQAGPVHARPGRLGGGPDTASPFYNVQTMVNTLVHIP